ncbi:MAG: hypothetical protein KH283_00850, partial [Collinsella sp.]|nr:hypothetical protein [Collinsella sp.]
GRLPGLDIMLHPQINAHKESLPFLMSKKWEAVQCGGGLFACRTWDRAHAREKRGYSLPAV